MKKTTKKVFDAVGFQQQQREILSKKLVKMTTDEIVAYFKMSRNKKQVRPSMTVAK